MNDLEKLLKKNGVEQGKSDKKRIAELEAENAELKSRVEDTENALVELAEILVGE